MTLLSRLGRTSSIQPITLQRVAILRVSSDRHFLNHHKLPVPPKPKYQVKLSPDEVGHFKYERYWSRDNRYRPQMTRDTPTRFFFYHFEHEWELWPVAALFIFSNLLIVIITVILFRHIEVWANRTNKLPPWDWSRVRENYWKLPTVLYDPTGMTHQRLLIMEKLQDEMLEAARKRGTRD